MGLPEAMLGGHGWYELVEDRFEPRRIWILARDGVRAARITAFDRDSDQVVFQESFDGTYVQQVLVGARVVWIMAADVEHDTARLLETTRQGNLVRDLQLPTGARAFAAAGPGHLVFMSDRSASGDYVLDLESGRFALETELGGYRFADTRKARWLAGAGHLAASHDRQLTIFSAQGVQLSLPGAPYSPKGAFGPRRAWLANLVWGNHFPPAGIVGVDLQTSRIACYGIGNRRQPGVRMIATDLDAVWFLFADGLGRLSHDGSESEVLRRSLVTRDRPLAPSARLLVDDRAVWILDHDRILRLEKTTFEELSLPYDSWQEKRALELEEAEWEPYVGIEERGEEELLEFLRQRMKALESLRYQVELGFDARPEIFRPCYDRRRADVLGELERLKSRFIDARMLDRLPRYEASVIFEIARILALHDRRDSIPALRRVVQTSRRDLDVPLSEYSPETPGLLVRWALKQLGDRRFLEEHYATELEAWTDDLLSRLSARQEGSEPITGAYLSDSERALLRSIIGHGGEEFLARRVIARGRVLAESVYLSPFVLIPGSARSARKPDFLKHGEEVAIIARNPAALVVVARGVVGWIADSRLVLEGTGPESSLLRQEIAELWTKKDLEPLIRLLQIQRLRRTDGSRTGSAPQSPSGVGGSSDDSSQPPHAAARLLVDLAYSERSPDSRCSLVQVELRNLLDDSTPQAVTRTLCYYDESSDSRLRITGVRNGKPRVLASLQSTRFAVEGIEGEIRQTEHFAQLDDDPDLELITLQGTPDCPETWAIDVYDYDGEKFEPVPWPPSDSTRRWLKNRFRESQDVMERTVIRSHFGFRGDDVPP